MGSGFSKMKKQARQMQEEMGKMQEELKKKEVQGSSGNGLVTLTLTGEKALKNIQIKPECTQDIEGLQDLIKAAFDDAYRKISETSPSLFPF